jgi:hypothetical protein
MNISEQVPDYIRSLIPYEPGKPIEEVEREFGISSSVKLASNENPLGPSPKALGAIRERLEQLHLYPDGDCFYLKRSLATKLGVAPENLLFGNGSNEIIELAARTFLRPGDEAVMAQQAFVVYQLIVQAVGGKSKAVPLRDFTHDPDHRRCRHPAYQDRFPGQSEQSDRNDLSAPGVGELPQENLARRSPDRRRSLLRVRARPGLPGFATLSRRRARHADLAHLLQAVRSGGFENRLRRWAEESDRADAARAPAFQRQRRRPMGGTRRAR